VSAYVHVRVCAHADVCEVWCVRAVCICDVFYVQAPPRINLVEISGQPEQCARAEAEKPSVDTRCVESCNVIISVID